MSSNKRIIDLSFSSLSNKPADLNTTDVEMSAIRIFLDDESHKTIATTPDTTCSEILSKILCKLGLTQDKDDYVLQLQYASGSKVAIGCETMLDLVPAHYDSLERIYLCHRSNISQRKASLQSTVFPLEALEKTEKTKMTNKEITELFSSAWTVGSILKEDEDHEKQPHAKKRKQRLSSSRGWQMRHSSKQHTEASELNSARPNRLICSETVPDFPSSSRESSGIFEDFVPPITADHLSDLLVTDLSSSPLENILEEAIDRTLLEASPQAKNADQMTRDSGIVQAWQESEDDEDHNDNDNDDHHDNEDIKLASSLQHAHSLTSLSSSYSDDVSKLKSFKSIELLTSDCINEIAQYTLSYDSADEESDTPINSETADIDEEEEQHNYFRPPPIPKRVSSLLPCNHQVSNKVLIQQGKRLCAILNIGEHHKESNKLTGNKYSLKTTFHKMLKSRKNSLPVIDLDKTEQHLSKAAVPSQRSKSLITAPSSHELTRLRAIAEESNRMNDIDEDVDIIPPTIELPSDEISNTKIPIKEIPSQTTTADKKRKSKSLPNLARNTVVD